MLGYAAALLSGFLAKLTDSQVDEQLWFGRNASYVTAILYGGLGGFLTTLSPQFATVFWAILVAVLVTGKIDSKEHQLAVGAFIVAAFLLGTKTPDAAILLFLASAAALDEKLNDLADYGELKSGVVKKIARYRILLDVAALAISAITRDVSYIAAVLSFDIGYQAGTFASKKIANPHPPVRGTHLMLDLREGGARGLDSEKIVEKFLKDVPKALRMRAITKPVLKRVGTGRDYGISGFVMIAESHISVHTYPRKRAAFIDAFSCREFDVAVVKEMAERTFGGKAEAKSEKRSIS
ncbi:S-adenosylmethionine decarboxylase proenzyme [Candidatus Norongarragalina meridionalis]|nr:S-adenosylmethionine decarboxylase proenzyme [Candidatus Norongarragalina meridionalis]